MSELVPLPALSREVAMLTGKPAPSYRSLWMKIASGQLPAETRNNRYYADPRAVALALGLTIPAAHTA